jgi:hypothetical protein
LAVGELLADGADDGGRVDDGVDGAIVDSLVGGLVVPTAVAAPEAELRDGLVDDVVLDAPPFVVDGGAEPAGSPPLVHPATASAAAAAAAIALAVRALIAVSPVV